MYWANVTTCNKKVNIYKINMKVHNYLFLFFDYLFLCVQIPFQQASYSLSVWFLNAS